MSRGEKTEEIYTSLPRFVIESSSRNSAGKPAETHYLPPVLREFEWKGRQYAFIISPATIFSSDGGENHFYPSTCEQMIELGLRNLAVRENPNFLDEENRLCFRLSQLRREIEEIIDGSRYSEDEIKLGLNILADTKYELHSGASELCVRPIEQLITRDQNNETYYLARFSSLFLHKNKAFNFCFGDGDGKDK